VDDDEDEYEYDGDDDDDDDDVPLLRFRSSSSSSSWSGVPRRAGGNRRREGDGHRTTSRRRGDGWNEYDGADRNDSACSRPMMPVVRLILRLFYY